MRCRKAREILAWHYLNHPVTASELEQAKSHAGNCVRCAVKSLEMIRAIAFGQEMEASCEEYRQLLADHIAGEAKGKGALKRFSRIQNHLSYCPSCHREYLVLQEIEKATKKRGKAIQYPDFDLSFLHRGATEEPEPEEERMFPQWPWNVRLVRRKTAIVALASTVFVAIVIACCVPTKQVTYTEMVTKAVTETYYEEEPYTEQEEYTVAEPKQISASLTHVIPPYQEFQAPLFSVDLSDKQNNRITVVARTESLVVERPASYPQPTYEEPPPKMSCSVTSSSAEAEPQSRTPEVHVEPGRQDYRYSYVPEGQVEFSFVPVASGPYHFQYFNENSYPLAVSVSATWSYEKTITKYRDVAKTRTVEKQRVVMQTYPEIHQKRVTILSYLLNRE